MVTESMFHLVLESRFLIIIDLYCFSPLPGAGKAIWGNHPRCGSGAEGLSIREDHCPVRRGQPCSGL